jgi:hypothetical protein
MMNVKLNSGYSNPQSSIPQLSIPQSNLHFGSVMPPPVSDYANPAAGNGSDFLRMYTTSAPGSNKPWDFAHRSKGKGAVHCLTLYTDSKTNEQFILLLLQKRLPMGGKTVIECPAGLVGDKDPSEVAREAGPKEVKEELGFNATGSGALASNAFATSPGMTTEQKWFSWVTATGEAGEQSLDESEKASIQGYMKVPVETFANYEKFTQWLKEQETAGLIVGMDVLAARALMPPLVGGRLSLEA